MCFAIKPLSIQELREAIALDIHTSHASLQESRTFGQYVETDEEMERRVLSLSQGLAEVLSHGRKRIVQLVHQSVMDFLLQDGFRLFEELLPDYHPNGSIVAWGHFWISRACIKFISMEEVVSLPTIELESGHRRRELQERSKRFVFIEYASEYWIAHAQIVEKENVPQDDLVTLLQSDSIALRALHDWHPRTVDMTSDRLFFITQGMSLLHIASSFGLLTVVSCILQDRTRNTEIDDKDDNGNTPLQCAAEAGHEAVVKSLLEAGVAVDPKGKGGRTSIFIASHNGTKNFVDLIDSLGGGEDTVLQDGSSPLSSPTWRASRTVAERLLENEAQANYTDNDGTTPLSWAARNGHGAVVKTLLENGAKVNATGNDGETPLSWATKNGHESIVEVLTGKSAPVNTTNTEDRAPISWAVYYGHESIVRLLLEHGANPDSIWPEDTSYPSNRIHGILEIIQCTKEGKPLPPMNQGRS